MLHHVSMTLATLQALTSFWPYAHSCHLGFIGVGENILLISSALRPHAHSSHLYRLYWDGGEHSTYITRFEASCSQQPFRLYWGGGGGEHSTYLIRFVVAHVSMTLATLQALTSFWPYSHSSHLGFIGVGENILLTSSALRPYAHSRHLGFIGMWGRGGTFYLQMTSSWNLPDSLDTT